MINYYQPFLLPFLRTQTYRLPEGVSRTYFVSFEDALWVLLRTLQIPKDSTVLLPDFYCIDVIENIKAHGLHVEYYPLDDHFQITEKELQPHITKHRPHLLIIFHACGITSAVTEKLDRILQKNRDLIVIEDAVQRLINPEKVAILSPRHYVIDSLRKVSPLPGSFLYRRKESPFITPDRTYKEWQYVFLSGIYYALFSVCNVLGTVLSNPSLVIYAHETILAAHDNLIGDSQGGYAGNPIFPHIHKRFDFEKVANRKEAQVTRYDNQLRLLTSRFPTWYGIRIPTRSRGSVHAYPVGIKHPQRVLVMKYIQSRLLSQGIPVWFKFTDSPWSGKRGVLFLPMGFHINAADITRISAALEEISRWLPVHSPPRG